MRKIMILICLLPIACASWAQTNKASWTNLSALQPGQKIQIIDVNAKKHSGTFVSDSDTAISYQDGAGGQTIQRQDVRSLERANRRLHHTLIGAAAGFGVGAGAGAGTPGL